MPREYRQGTVLDQIDEENKNRDTDIGHIEQSHQPVFHKSQKSRDEIKIKRKLDLDKPEVQTFKITAAAVDEIIDAAAQRVGEQKAQEYLDKAGWIKKSFVRPSEKALIEKFKEEVKAEILANRNLMASIEGRALLNSKVEKLHADSDRATQAIFEVLVERAHNLERKSNEEFWGLSSGPEDKKSKQKNEKYETREKIAHTASMDAAAADLIAKWAFEEIPDRNAFDALAEEKIFRKLTTKANLGKAETFASNLFFVAEQYKESIEKTLKKAAKEFSPAEKTKVRNYLRGSVRLDINMALSKADMARRKPEGVMRAVEAVVDFTQMPYLAKLGKFAGTGFGKFLSKIPGGNFMSKTIDRLWGLSVGNPLVYAWVGNRLAYAAASGVGIKTAMLAGTALAVGLGPGTIMAIGAALGGGSYFALRKAAEMSRDRRRREDKAILGTGPKESLQPVDTREIGLKLILQLTEKKEPLTEEEKQKIGQWAAALRLHNVHNVNILGVSREEGESNKSNIVAVDNLQEAILNLLEKKHAEFQHYDSSANNWDAQARDFSRYIGDAERKLLEKIKLVDKEKAAEIVRGALVAGVVGGAIAGVGSILSPEVLKLLKEGVNVASHNLGGHDVFDTNYNTYAEALWHKGAEKLGWVPAAPTHFNGEMVPNDFAIFNGHTQIKLPVGYGSFHLHNNSGDFIVITDPAQHVVGNPIQVGADGIINPASWNHFTHDLGWQVNHADAAAAAHGGIPGHSRSFTDWLHDLRSHLPNGVKIEEAHFKGNYDNLTPNSDLNELNFHINVAGNGDVHWDVQNLMQYGSFHQVGGTFIPGAAPYQPDMTALLHSGDLKFVIIPDAAHPHDAIFLNMDSTGHAIVPKDIAQCLLNSATGHPKEGVLIGSAHILDRPGGGKDMIMINAIKGHGEAVNYDMSSAATPTGTTAGPAIWDARPPIVYTSEAPYGPAGYRRQTDEDITTAREKRETKELERQWKEQLAKMSPEEKMLMAQNDMLAVLSGSDKTLTAIIPAFDKTSARYRLDEAQQEKLLVDICKAKGMTDEEVKTALAQQVQQNAAPVAVAAGGGTPEAQASSTPAAQSFSTKKTALLNSLLAREMEASRKAAFPEAAPDRRFLSELNKRESNRAPHLEFSADDGLLKKKTDLDFINSLAESVHDFLVAEGLDANVYSLASYKIKITETPPYGWNEKDKSLLSVGTTESPNKIALDILEKIKTPDSPLEYRYRDLTEVNNSADNKEPTLKFSYDPGVLIGIGQSAVNNYGKRLHSELRSQIGTDPRFEDALLRINFINPRDPMPDVPDIDAHGYTIMTLPFGDNVKRDAGIILREMKRLAPETLPPVDRVFLRDINNLPGNQNPNIAFDMPDSIIREMGSPEAKIYVTRIAAKMEAKLNQLKAANGGRDRAFFESLVISVGVSRNAADLHGTLGADGSFQFTFPAYKGTVNREPDNRIEARINQQFEEIRNAP